MPAPSLTKNSNNPAAAKAPAVLIPFTRAARTKSVKIGSWTNAMTTAQQQLAPIQIPANGYIRRLLVEIQCVTGGNAAATALKADAPANILTNISLAAANGDSLINPLDGFDLAMIMKYGAFASDAASRDMLADPAYSVTTGAGATGGSFTLQYDIPFEVDQRDALGCLPNMAANQAFLLQLTLNSSGNIYSTAPTTLGTVTMNITAEYWAAPAPVNAQGIAQQVGPRVANAVSLLQTQMPTITPSTDQTIQLLNVGNSVRWVMFILRDSSNVRTESSWPAQSDFLINNDIWLVKRINTWIRQMGSDYRLTGAKAAVPTLKALDNGVYILSDFMNSGSPGHVASGSANRDGYLVTGSATAFNFESISWGTNANNLKIITNSLRVPDPGSFYAPLGI